MPFYIIKNPFLWGLGTMLVMAWYGIDALLS